MTCLSLRRGGGWCSYLSLVILISFLQQQTVHIENGVLAAPQKNSVNKIEEKPVAASVATGEIVGRQSNGNNSVVEQQKTADLTLLINETLKINNKSTSDGGDLSTGDKRPNFREDWTFDRVEYDLMDFLQELNARYSYANKSQQAGGQESVLERRQDEENCNSEQQLGANSPGEKSFSHGAQSLNNLPSTQNQETVTKTTIEAVKKELEAISPAYDNEQTSSVGTSKPDLGSSSVTRTPSVFPSATGSSVLPISLASNDHDISESTWQYGIFDRFTRPRTTTTTTQSPDTLAVSGSNAQLDVRAFNSDECGLRTYRMEPNYYPVEVANSGLQADTDEMTKELSQRRQRPPPGTFFSSHRKYHQTSATSGDTSEVFGDELDRERPLDSLPPFDRYGEPSAVAGPSSSDANEESNTAKYHKAQATQGNSPGASASSDVQDDRGPAADTEFNLSLRRQWLQQQLGSTLQMLGLNSSGSHNTLVDLFNKTGPMRENMMKMSATRNNKLGKAYTAEAKPQTAFPNSQAKLPELQPLSEQELKSRQDELKLEARVIGGNDARLGDSPWSASLQALVSRPGTGGVEYRHYCGGTIISEYYILTAAHCLDFMVGRESRLFVVIGDLNWRMSAASMYGRRFGIEKLIIHGGYKSTAFGHDIGLIKTKESMKPLKVNGRYIINSVCLPEKNVEHTGEAELVGWGLFSNRNEMADSLQVADVPILPRPLCVDLYRRRTGLIQWLIGIELITEKQICAGTFGRGICQGDSGSALVFNDRVQSGPDRAVTSSSSSASGAANNRLKSNSMRDQQQRATIIGVVAFGGIRRCSYQSLPGVYMQTSKYLDWILPRIQ